MVPGFALLSLICGGSAAWAAGRAPACSAVALERWGGGFLIAGLGLLGAGLQSFHG